MRVTEVPLVSGPTGFDSKRMAASRLRTLNTLEGGLETASGQMSETPDDLDAQIKVGHFALDSTRRRPKNRLPSCRLSWDLPQV